MSTSIKHYRNSFLDIENKKLRILMDPWINTANEGSWAATKNGDKYMFDSIKKRKIDYVYISHLHTDHFDLKFLKKLKSKQKKNFKIIIKKFKDDRLKKQLISNGFSRKHIIDISEFEVYSLSKESKIIILPQISSSNTPNEYIKYDLDTSCIFIDNNVSLYNQVDNPYSIQDIKFIMKNLKKKINTKFDLAFIPYCAASEFPQSFINLKRAKEKRNIIIQRVKKFLSVSRIIQCSNIIPAGGSYHLDSIFAKLNKFLAIPNFRQINSIYKKYKKEKFNLIDTKNNFFIANNHNIKFKENDYNTNFKSLINKTKKNIRYFKTKKLFRKDQLQDVLGNLEDIMPDFKKRLYNKTNTEIELCIWKKHPLLVNNIKFKEPPIRHQIKFSSNKKEIKLKIHIYYKLLIAIIKRKVSWNEVQNHCLFERNPNKYDPDVVFWMNLYKF